MKRAFWLLLAAGVAWAGCGDSDSDSNTGNNNSNLTCESGASQYCEKFNQCFPLGIQASFGTVERCKQSFANDCTLITTAKGSKTSVSQLSGCLSQLTSASCDQFFAQAQQIGDTAACQPVAGELADGTACQQDSQCQGTHCQLSSAFCGVCKTRAKAGEDCSGTACEAGYRCASGKCVKPIAKGAACDQAGAPCDTGTTCRNGVCSEPLKKGEACDEQSACDPLAALACNPLSKMCEDFKLANAGESCGILQTGLVGCAASGKCEIAQGTTSGTCKAAAKDGEACDPQNGPSCVEPAECVNSVCTIATVDSCK